MVEMLGMLAIIGILSIGGLAGYSLAITKNKTNNLINDLNLRSTIVSQQLSQGKSASLSEFKQPAYYPITLETFIPNPTNYFGLKAQNVEKEVCEQIMSDTPAAINGIYQNSTHLSKASNCLDKTTLTFVYANGLNHDDNFGNNNDYTCTEKCPTGSINPSCTSSEKQKDTGITVCGMICAVCLNDTCPVGTFKSCGTGETPSYHSQTKYGSNCYSCSLTES
jgi:type II secretory pathway pseudopilin PulG